MEFSCAFPNANFTVSKNCRHSLLYLPHPFVVPGGRFREIYYWDTYWVIRCLLKCEMFDTVKGILLNFAHFIKVHKTLKINLKHMCSEEKCIKIESKRA